MTTPAAARRAGARPDVLITEATFGLPKSIHRWQPAERWPPNPELGLAGRLPERPVAAVRLCLWAGAALPGGLGSALGVQEEVLAAWPCQTLMAPLPDPGPMACLQSGAPTR